ncbi:MAG: UMP kinase [Patescibacteria group bacterium]
MKYKRVMLKLSGEFLQGSLASGIDQKIIKRAADEILEIANSGVEIIVEVGAGNIYRGKSASKEIQRNIADIIGMLGSITNAICLREAIGHRKETRALSAIFMPYVIQHYTPAKAIHYLEEKKIVILGGGTGMQFFTTDSGAVLHALQTKCEVVLKGTNVDGVYSADPKKVKTAKKFNKISYQEVISKKLEVMDMTAFTLAQDNNLPIFVFDITKEGNLKKAVIGEEIGTLVSV